MSTSALGAHYDALYRGTGFGDAPAFYRWILRLSDPRADDRLLDLGCGAGGMLAALGDRARSAVGLDIAGEALAHARRSVPAARLVRGDGCRLPFTDACFDVVWNLGNLEHFPDVGAGVREMRRVLAPDGRAWVLLPNLFYSGVLWRVLRGREGPNHHQPIDRFATREEWAAWLEWGGLSVRRIIPYHKGKRWKRLLPSALAWHFLYECTAGDPSDDAPPPAPLGRIVPTLERTSVEGR